MMTAAYTQEEHGFWEPVPIKKITPGPGCCLLHKKAGMSFPAKDETGLWRCGNLLQRGANERLLGELAGEGVTDDRHIQKGVREELVTWLTKVVGG